MAVTLRPPYLMYHALPANGNVPSPTVAPVASASGLPSWLSQYSAPTTGDAVHFGQAPNGQYVYVGPDNQPYVGSAGDFYHGAGGTVNPIMGQAKLSTWSALGVGNESNVVTASTYAGPGAAGAATDAQTYGALPTSEQLSVLPTSTIAGGYIPVGTYATPDSNTIIQKAAAVLSGTFRANFANAPDVPGANASVFSGGGDPRRTGTDVPVGTTTSGGVTGTTAGYDPTGASGITDPNSAASALIGGALGGSGGVPGAGSIASAIPSPVVSTHSSSGPSPIAMLAILAAIAILGFLAYKKFGKHAATAPEK